MALIKCPECSKEISSKAPTCPQCGAPVGVSQTSEAVTTIQGTTKILKIQQAFAIMLILAGMMSCIGAGDGTGRQDDIQNATYMLSAGFFWFIIVRIAIWWKHG
jgi:hypothetical protein